MIRTQQKRLFSCSACRSRLKRQLNEIIKDDNDKSAPTTNQSSTGNRPQLPPRVLFSVNDVIQKRIEDFFATPLKKILKEKATFNLRHGYVYKHLGTTPDRVQNSFLNKADTSKLLEQDKLPEAVYLARLGGEQGTVSKNEILKYVMRKGDQKVALDLNRVLVKWGVPNNEYTLSILSHKNVELASQGQEEVIDKFHTEVERLGLSPTSPSYTVLANTTLSTLSLCPDLDTHSLTRFFETLERKDQRSYTAMFKCLARTPDSYEIREQLWHECLRKQKQKSRKNFIDNTLAHEYFAARLADLKQGSDDTTIIDDYFKVYNGRAVGMPSAVDGEEGHLSLSTLDLDQLVRILQAKDCNDQVVNIVQIALNDRNTRVDVPIFASYLDSLLKTKVTVDGKFVAQALEQAKGICDGPRLPPALAARLIKLFTVAQDSRAVDFKLIDDIVGSIGHKGRSSKLQHAVLETYVDVFLHVYKTFTVSGQFDRSYGIKALRRIIRSLADVSNRTTLTKVEQLLAVVRDKKSWAYTQLVWMGRTKEAVTNFLEKGDKHEFQRAMATIVQLLE